MYGTENCLPPFQFKVRIVKLFEPRRHTHTRTFIFENSVPISFEFLITLHFQICISIAVTTYRVDILSYSESKKSNIWSSPTLQYILVKYFEF